MDGVQPEPTRAPGRPVGVNLAGYLDATVGVREAARHVAAALQEAGVTVARVGLSSAAAPRSQDGAPTEPATHPITLVCVNPDAMTGARDERGAGAFEARHVIGMWWWEVAAVHGRWLRAFDLGDEVWAGSRFVADVFAAVAPVPVVHVPMPVPEPVISAAGRDTLGLAPHRFLFGLVFDYASVAARKNPLGLTIAEAMLLGTPVIATNDGGSCDFVTAFDALAVDARMVPIGPGNDPYPADGEWPSPISTTPPRACAPSSPTAPAHRRARSGHGRRSSPTTRPPSPAARWPSASRGSCGFRCSFRSTAPARPRTLDLAAVRARMASGPKAAPGGERGARGAVRDAALRAMRPYTVHQRLVDEEILRVLQTLDERVQGLAAGQQALAAELARLRDEQRRD